MHVCTDQKLSDSGKLRCVATSTDVPEQASKFALGAGRGSAPEIGAHISGLARSLVSKALSEVVLVAQLPKELGRDALHFIQRRSRMPFMHVMSAEQEDTDVCDFLLQVAHIEGIESKTVISRNTSLHITCGKAGGNPQHDQKGSLVATMQASRHAEKHITVT